MYFIQKSSNSSKQDTSRRITKTCNEDLRDLWRHYKSRKFYLKF